MSAPDAPDSSLRSAARRLAERPAFTRAILWLIVVNSVLLGLETSDTLMERYGTLLTGLDSAILAVFVAELVVRIAAYRQRFFTDAWSLFDLGVVAVSLTPSAGPFAVLRALRVLRVLRLVSALPRMRRVVQALLEAIPGLISIVLLIALLFYVGAVLATKLFGPAFPEWFGTLGASLYTLFQVMTLESWSMGIVRPVLEVHPWAWAFFVPFILITTFTMLNLFIAVIVNAMQTQHEDDLRAFDVATERSAHDERSAILVELRSLREEVRRLTDDRG